MEDYIYIIIAIVLSIFGAINNKKKKAQQQALEEEQETPPKSRSVLEELLDDPFFQSEEAEQPVPQVIEPITPPPKEKPVFEKRISFKTPLRETEKREPMMQPMERSTKIRNSIRSDFSLKKAVIYNEILNRKY